MLEVSLFAPLQHTGSRNPRTEPNIAPESYVRIFLNCNPPLRCAEDIVQSQCAESRPVGTVGLAIAEQPVDID